jgi:tight adherence protein B
MVTPAAWLALAAAAALAGSVARAPSRVDALSVAGRLVRREASASPRAWRAPAAVIGVALVTAVVAAGASGGVPLGVAAAAVAGTGWFGVRALRRGRAEARAQAALAAALQALTAELDAGGRPADALSAAAEVAPEHGTVFADAAREAARGGDVGDVLAGTPATRALACAWRVGEGTGTALSGVLGRVAADVAAAGQHRRTLAVALAGPRSSAAVLTGLPMLGIGLGAAMGANPLHFLLRTPTGTVTCCAGVLLDAGGVLWMQWILRRAEAG